VLSSDVIKKTMYTPYKIYFFLYVEYHKNEGTNLYQNLLHIIFICWSIFIVVLKVSGILVVSIFDTNYLMISKQYTGTTSIFTKFVVIFIFCFFFSTAAIVSRALIGPNFYVEFIPIFLSLCKIVVLPRFLLNSVWFSFLVYF
jgi:hypothetical protein